MLLLKNPQFSEEISQQGIMEIFLKTNNPYIFVERIMSLAILGSIHTARGQIKKKLTPFPCFPYAQRETYAK